MIQLPMSFDSDSAVSSSTVDAAKADSAGGAARGWSRIAAFFVLVVTLGFGLDAVIDRMLRGVEIGEFGVWNRIVQGRIDADVVVSGSSRAQTHYDPRPLSQALGRSVYNIGLNGSQTDMQLARLKTYLRHNRKPQMVIHNLDAFSLQVTHGGVYDPVQYIPYLDEPDLYEALARLDPNVWKARNLPLYGYAAQDLRFGWLAGLRDAVWQRPDGLLDGFRARHTPWTEDFEHFLAANPDGVEVAVEEEGVRRFEEMLKLCADLGIRLVLVYSPEYEPVQRMTRNRAQIFARYEALARRHGAQLIDFSNSPIARDKRYFYNSQHLNAEGAQAFSRALARQLAAGG
jgi:hypothetical protein